MEHRLAAVLMADVVGYSRLIEADEMGTLLALKELSKAVLEPVVKSHRGRIVKVMGDGVLIEFGSALSAVACSVELQRGMGEANRSVPAAKAIVFRIGINLGEVAGDGDDIYGDGVNIAARLQTLAEPGGICISGKVYDEVRGKQPANFVAMGEQSVKNIARPIRIFQLRPENPASDPSLPHARSTSNKPSIAVLPFTNMSGEQDQQYLSDGITEDIITELTRFHSLFVIARNSSFQFRGPAVDIAEVHRKLGARYVVEGSLRKLGERMRITTQLIDAITGMHLWAERYDRALGDIFAWQDEVVALVASMIAGHAAADSTSQARRKPPTDWGAYDYYLQGREHLTQYEINKSEPLFLRSVGLDPTFAQGHAYLAQALVGRYWYDDDLRTLHRARDSAQLALSLDRSDGVCHQSMGLVLTHMHEHADAGVHLERARSLNPLDVNIAGDYASWLNYGGRPEEALAVLEMALLRDPLPPVWFWEVKGSSLFLRGRYAEALRCYLKAGDHFFIHASLAATYAHLGEMHKAHAEVHEALKRRSDLTVPLMTGDKFPFADRATVEPFALGFRKAGFPE